MIRLEHLLHFTIGLDSSPGLRVQDRDPIHLSIMADPNGFKTQGRIKNRSTYAPTIVPKWWWCEWCKKPNTFDESFCGFCDDGYRESSLASARAWRIKRQETRIGTDDNNHNGWWCERCNHRIGWEHPLCTACRRNKVKRPDVDWQARIKEAEEYRRQQAIPPKWCIRCSMEYRTEVCEECASNK